MTAYDYLERVRRRLYERYSIHASHATNPRSLPPRRYYFQGYQALIGHQNAHPELADVELPVELYESDVNSQLTFNLR